MVIKPLLLDSRERVNERENERYRETKTWREKKRERQRKQERKRGKQKQIGRGLSNIVHTEQRLAGTEEKDRVSQSRRGGEDSSQGSGSMFERKRETGDDGECWML
mmetsp:Transcript_13353/g.20061  ORF Transcript_13353/g.20061 Transcript_13353/m.20061 type:complete len:106 (-) Transcript_13353:220-537(-)